MSELKHIEEQTYSEDDGPKIPPPDIIAYNELRSCADLHRMKTEGILNIQPDFQREIVWQKPAQTRFIDSLIKQLPIPSMCFSLDFKAQKWMVIDGLQRMSTICNFLSGGAWKLSKLDDIDQAISGQSINTFHDKKSKLHQYLTRVQNLSLPITVLRCDYSNRSHNYYLFTIFHRLNTGGMKLNNQEIRNCIYSGKLNDLLKVLDKDNEWMKLNRIKKSSQYRYSKQELILRLFAFHDSYKSYNGRLARFLNEYMEKHRNLPKEEANKKQAMFHRTVEILYKRIFKGIHPQRQSLSVLEVLLIGVSFNLDYLEGISDVNLKKLYQTLLENEELSESKLIEGLSGKPRVIGRIEAARAAFSGE